MQFLPSWFHGILDYVFGLAILFAPEIFGFSNYGGAAVEVARIVGVALLVYSLITNYGPGAIRALPMAVHLTVDFLAGLFLALSPWIFGFATQSNNAWMPHLFSGIILMVMVLVSRTISVEQRRPAHA